MSDARHWLTLSSGLCAVLVTASACPLVNDPNHCANMDVSPCLAAQVCDPCTPSSESNGCVAQDAAVDRDPALPGCQLADGGVSTDPTVGEETTVTDGTDPTVSTTLEPDTTVTDGSTETETGPPGPCTSNEECSGSASTPFCGPDGVCVDCLGMGDPDAACAGLDAAMPACVEGACVQCSEMVTSACTGMTPICDTGSNQCIACTAHDQCGDAACNLFTGACLPQDTVLSVGPGQDHATLAAAVATVPAGGQATITVYDDSDLIYNEAVTVGGGRVVAFLASPGYGSEWHRTALPAAPQLTVSSNATVLMDGLTLVSNASTTPPAISVIGGSLWLDRGQILRNDGAGVVAENADLVVRNSFLNANINRAVVSAQGADVDIIYSTLVASFGASTALNCDGSSTVTVRDSILLSYSADPEVVCDADIQRTASESMLPGRGNQGVGDVMAEWFVNDAEGDYHLSAASGEGVFEGIAEWNDGDPLFDIDGQPRSGVDGTPEHAGADRP